MYAYAAAGRIEVGPRRDGLECPAVRLDHPLHLVEVLHRPIGHRVVAHGPTLPEPGMSHPPCTIVVMEPGGTLRFTAAARALADAARRLGLEPPSFRSPPRLGSVDRSLRRHPRGTVVAVRLRERPWPAVLADMVEGVIAANDLSASAADCVRGALWQAVADPSIDVAQVA